jgi:homocitrate synthase NifV
VFDHESGIHCKGQLKNPLAFQPFLPEDVGHAPGRIVAGSHSGTASLRHILGESGISLDNRQSEDLLKAVRHFCRTKGESLTEPELTKLYYNTLKKHGKEVKTHVNGCIP